LRGLCTSLPFFFLETEQEGGGNGRRGAARPWVRAPLVHGNARGGGENGEEAEGVRFRPCGDGLQRAVHGDGWWPAMVSSGGELQREVEEGMCWGCVGRVRGGLGSDL
jgi:hypothetical protein